MNLSFSEDKVLTILESRSGKSRSRSANLAIGSSLKIIGKSTKRFLADGPLFEKAAPNGRGD